MVKIYGTTGCVWCKKAVELCEDYCLTYQYQNVDTSDELKEIFKSLFPEAKTVPQIVWNGRHIGGYNDFLIEIENTRTYGDGKI